MRTGLWPVSGIKVKIRIRNGNASGAMKRRVLRSMAGEHVRRERDFHAMNFRKRVSRVPLALLCFGLANCGCPAVVAGSVEGNVPSPSRAFTSRTTVAFYADLHSAGKSAVWKALAEKAGPLMEQLGSLPQGQMPSWHKAQVFPGLKGTDVAEMAVAFEGEKILGDLQSNQFDPSSGVLLVVRLAGTQEVKSLIQQALDAIDKEKPGLRSQIEKSRRQVGAAEFFDVPAEALGEQKLPFTVSCAVGPGLNGTIIGMGRSENLRAFLSGQTEGGLRGQINEALSRRGQIWVHVTVPKEATKNGGGGGAGLSANPMLAGLGQSMEKVREISLSLNFATSQIDFDLNLECADAAAAGQLSQGIQGLIGMMQLGSQQNRSSLPPFVGKIKAVTEGAALRLTTAFTMRDFDLAFQNMKRGAPAAPPRAPAPAPKSEAAPAPVPSAPPVEVEFVQFSSQEQESLRTAQMRVHNRSAQPVKELKLTFTYWDDSGRKLGQWTRLHTSLTGENLIGGDATRVVDCLAFSVPAFTKKVSVTLHEVTFAGGEKWSLK